MAALLVVMAPPARAGCDPPGAEATVPAAIEMSERCLYAGRIEVGLEWIERALAGVEDRLPRADLLNRRAWLLATQGFSENRGYPEAVTAATEAETIATAARDSARLATALLYEGFALYGRTYNTGEGDYRDARDLVARSLEIRETIGDRRGVAESLIYVGILAERLGDHERALDLYRRSLGIAKEGGFQLEESYAIRHIGFILRARGDLRGALDAFRESLALREAVEFRIYLPFSRIAVGDVRLQMGEAPAALEQYERACEIAREIRAERALVLCEISRGDALRALDRPGAAREAYASARERAGRIGFPRGVELVDARSEDESTGPGE